MSKKYIFHLISLVLAHIVEQGRSISCISEDTSYICSDILRTDNFPSALPTNVDKVTLIGTDESSLSFPHSPFNDRSWENVSELTLLKFGDIEKIEQYFLDGLSHLRYLSISGFPRLRSIDPDAFQSTLDLVALHLDGDINLELSVIEKALEGKVSKLKYVSLQGLGMDHHSPGIMGTKFFNAIREKNMSYLDVSSANIAGISVDSKTVTYSNLLYLDASYSKLAMIGIGHKSNFDYSLSKLEMLDVSGCLSIIHTLREQTAKKMDCDIPNRIKYVFAEALVKPDVRIELNIEARFNQCVKNNIEIVHLSKNRLVHLNVTVTGSYSFRGLVKLNLSMNHMEYISPSLLGAFPSLQILDLSENQLHKMQKMDDFNNFLRGNSELQIIVLRKNHLSIIPNLFVHSNKLKLLDLRENDLIHFNMVLGHLPNMQSIDLSKNRFKDLPLSFYNTLEEINSYQVKENQTGNFSHNWLIHSLDRYTVSQQYRYGYNPNVSLNLVDNLNAVSNYLTINLSDNPIECNCENLNFLTWCVYTKIMIVNRETLICKYEDANYPLDNNTLKKIEFDCQISSIIMKSILVTVSVILCSCAIVILAYRMHRKKCSMEDIALLKRFINQRKDNFSYLAFIPYSSHDSDLIESHFLTALNNGILHKLNLECEVLCTGNHFIPGMLIIDEIHRCVEKCLVVVPIITPAFVQSRWSQTECIVAIQKHKKVLVLMQENTNITQAESSVENLIEHYTRATWSNRNGSVTIHPSWNIICDRIISLAAATLKNQEQRSTTEPESLQPLIDKDTLKA
ncbi:hypothetical protein ACJMK2_035890 [Sinanodonta woodiana]|uniref:TIR domain-containing protein n=1 Tax=Sinanodonta woodiana TaxID=1069815 RepID=A0ABD3WFG9_SINWO